ncbi:hypothetical protein H5410_050011 [Solanum commersonii]|uniref:Uncharacterized protein n=1 Tax=Solanum commersonii TaxID=4109 RepID=A0A9J5WWM8_SOLCO|nr:hypothetical protein H5410_050011 [Solanum commersonii]
MTVYKKYTRERRGPSGQVRKSCAGAGKRTLQRRSRATGHLRNSFNRKSIEMMRKWRKCQKARAHKKPLLNPTRNPQSPPECTYTKRGDNNKEQR